MIEENDISAHHIASTQEKLDAIFGITGGKPVEDFLNELSVDTEKIEQTINNIDDTTKSAMRKIDSQIEAMPKNGEGVSILELNDMQLSLKSIEDMIDMSKQVFKHIVESIMSTDLIDSELVHSLAVLQESIHVNIVEFINFYKNKQSYIDKVKLSLLKQEQAKEMVLLKHKLQLELLQQKNASQSIDVTEGTTLYCQEDVIDAINKRAQQEQFNKE